MAEQNENEKIEINITNVHPRYVWKWKLKEEFCLICQQEFNVACNNCEHPIKCVPVKGKCMHTFHSHCLNEWLHTNEGCPVCRASFEAEKLYESPNEYQL